jgi:hypothetical protein
MSCELGSRALLLASVIFEFSQLENATRGLSFFLADVVILIERRVFPGGQNVIKHPCDGN